MTRLAQALVLSSLVVLLGALDMLLQMGAI